METVRYLTFFYFQPMLEALTGIWFFVVVWLALVISLSIGLYNIALYWSEKK